MMVIELEGIEVGGWIVGVGAILLMGGCVHVVLYIEIGGGSNGRH